MQTNAGQEEGAGLGALPEVLRDDSVPMCLRGFDENGLFGSNGKEASCTCFIFVATGKGGVEGCGW